MKSDIRPHTLPQLRKIPRCGAKTRKRTPCPNPCVKGRPRCRMHGCAPGAGGQPGNKNARKHGDRSQVAIMMRKSRQDMARQVKERFNIIMELLSKLDED